VEKGKMKLLALACASVLLLAGCDAIQQGAPGYDLTQAAMPMPTFADPARQAVVAQNTADAVAAIATQQAIVWKATEDNATAIAWSNQQSEINATEQAVNATQQAIEANVQSTQQAIAIAATGTSAAIDAMNKNAILTQTAVGMAMLDTSATQQAVDAKHAEISTRQHEYGITFIEQLGSTFIYVLTIFALVAAVVFGVMAWTRIRLRSMEIEALIEVQRAAAMRQRVVGNYFLEDGGVRLLPGAQPAPVVEDPPLVDLDREIKIAGRVVTQEELETNDQLNKERAARAAWKTASVNFLRWGEYAVDDKPLGYARRAICQHAEISEKEYATLTDLLSGMGFMEKQGGASNAPWGLALNESGEQVTVSQIIRSPKWVASFDYPKSPPPAVSVPPKKSPKTLAPHHTTVTTHHHTTPDTTTHHDEGGAFIIENDENGKRTVRPYTPRWSDTNPAPMTYEQLMRSKGIED
jgi:hypothetical protein